MKCPNCQFEDRDEARFCDQCGCDLSKPEDFPSPIDYSQPQSCTPKFVADKILTTRSSIEGEGKLVTVLFADVANYTSIAQKLDPEEVHQIMDGCFKILMDEIHRYEGTINQFTGDGVMALFGAPVAHEDHGQRACHAALSIQKAVEAYGEKIKQEYGSKFKMRIGLNSGPVIVGSIGDDLRMDYTALGDTTNLASRMQSMAEPGSVFVSGHTHRLARDFFQFESLGKVEVKGKEEPQEAYQLIWYTYALACATGTFSWLGRWVEALGYGQKALQIAQEYGDKSLTTFVALIISSMYTMKGELNRAVEYGEFAVDNAPTPMDEAPAQASLAWAWCRTGETARGIEVLDKLAPLFRSARFIPFEVPANLYLGEGYLLAGDSGKAAKTLDELLGLAHRYGMKGYTGFAHRLLAEIALKTNPDEAPSHFDKAISIFREIKAENELALAYSGMGRYHKQQGDTEQAREYLTKALEIFERLGTLIEPDKVREELAELPE